MHRLKVLVGVLKGVSYLQEQLSEVGYDLWTSSVLLHENVEPLIARFKVGENSSIKSLSLIFSLNTYFLAAFRLTSTSLTFNPSTLTYFHLINSQIRSFLLEMMTNWRL